MGLGLLGGGAAVALYGFTHVTGGSIDVSCGDVFCSNGSVGVQEKHATGVGIAGLAVAGVGGLLMAMGGGGSSPDITIVPKGVQVAKRISW